ncbi:ABC transporter permease [Cohnella laeviribosi]|uniref:ABC transporter permease n=1 Tax=Cohnella laeviribosi TaxID=380174 RepID=UPI0003794486|nr:ABC transporter permease [Cohnella laeviribosi]
MKSRLNLKSFNYDKFIREYAMLLIFIVIVIFFGLMNPKFLSWMNISNIIVQNSYILVVAVGISFVMMSGSLDLSVGQQISVIGVLTAVMMTVYEMPVWLAMAIGILAGIAMGFFNGGVAVRLKIEPLVVTIATSIVFKGVSNIISGGMSYNNFPASFRYITTGKILGLPVDVWIAIVSVLIASIIYNFTYFGRYIKAMGGNIEATRLAGVNVNALRIATFCISGFFVAIASFIYISKLATMNSSYGPGIEMTAMTAAILGGISFNSGEGKMWGLVVGVFTLAIIENGMQLAEWNQYIQYVVKGLILILAIGFDIHQRSQRAKKLS